MALKKPKIAFLFIMAFILIVGLIALKVTSTYFSTYRTAQTSLAEQYQRIMMDISSGLNKDVYRKLLDAGTKDNEYYSKVRSYLYDYHQKIQALYIYTLQFEADRDRSKVMVTATPPEVPLGTVEATIPPKQIRQLKEGKPTYTNVIVDKEYGTYLSVFAPLFDEEGKVTGAVGVDISADSLEQIGSNIINNNMTILAIDVFFAVLLMLLLFLFRLWYKKRYKEELKETELMYIAELGNVIHSLKTTRHDFNNHFHVVNGLLSMNRMDEAIQYLNSLHKETKIVDLSIRVKHPALLVLFHSKWELAQSKNINIKFEVDQSNYSSMETADLVKVFSNLIDNAIEATQELPLDMRVIRIVCKKLGSTYVFLVENPTSLTLTEKTSLFKKGFTTKQIQIESGKPSRGNGLSIVQMVVEKYKGELYYQYEKSRLLIQITIPTND
ncbi:GHKL domain-containing protein [Paenibacillus amylolyticus]|uniref:GHKL domain-containing protein n=1 Tax=Paenibacillus amylolyticus TaxID=1451 RepID=UPI003EC0CD9D